MEEGEEDDIKEGEGDDVKESLEPDLDADVDQIRWISAWDGLFEIREDRRRNTILS